MGLTGRSDKLASGRPSSSFVSAFLVPLLFGAATPVASQGQPWRAPRAPTTTTPTSSFPTTMMSSRMAMPSPPPRSPMSSPIFEARCRSPNFWTPRAPFRYPSSFLVYFHSNCILRFALCDARLCLPKAIQDEELAADCNGCARKSY